MSKTVLGIVLGAALGLIDGASAYLYPYPDVKAQILMIIIGSTFKGLVTGMVAGLVATRYRSLPLGIGVGLAVGLVLSWLVAMGSGYYAEIMTPGAILGAVVGFATQRYGREPRRARTA